MKDRTKLTLSAAAMIVAGFALSEARAGNLSATISKDNVEYFAVELIPGMAFQYQGSDPDATVLIDDITYTVCIDLQHLGGMTTTKYPIFTFSDLASRVNCPFNPAPNPAICPPAMGGPPPDGEDEMVTGSYPGYQVVIQRWIAARQGWFSLDLQECGPTTDVTIDAISHDVYAHMVAQQQEDFQSPANSAHGVGTGVGLMGWATNTSESRHYQTPYILGKIPQDTRSNRVYGKVPSSLIRYSLFRIFVKGRVVLDSADVPTVSEDFAVFPIDSENPCPPE